MGNTDSSLWSTAFLRHCTAQNKHGTPLYDDAMNLPTFTSKLDYVDPSVDTSVPAMRLGNNAAASRDQHRKVSCLMCTSAVSCSSRRSAIEQSGQMLRVLHHPNLFRCVSSSDNSSKQMCVIGVPQIDPLTMKKHMPFDLSGTSSSMDKETLSRFSLSEVLYGVAGVISAVEMLCGQPSSSMVLTELRPHQISVTASRHGSGESSLWIDSAAVHDHRWVLHDLSTLRSAKAQQLGCTIRSVGCFVADMIGTILNNDTLRCEMIALLDRCCASTVNPSSSSNRHNHDNSDEVEDDVDVAPGEAQGDEYQAGGYVLAERQPSESQATESAAGTQSLIAMRTLECAVTMLLDDVNAASASIEGSAKGPSKDSPCSSSNESSRITTPRSRCTKGNIPSFDSEGFLSSAEAIVHWVRFAVLDAVGVVESVAEVQCLLQRLRALIVSELGDPLCLALHHGSELYLNEAEDEIQRSSGAVSTLTMRSYETILSSIRLLQWEFQPQVSGGGGFDERSDGNRSFTSSRGHSGVSALLIWERRLLPWVLHPSHVSQPSASVLFDFLFSTVGTPRSLLTAQQTETVAVRWLVDCRNPYCRIAALRYGSILLHYLPPATLGHYLTTVGYVLFQGRSCLRGLQEAWNRQAAPKPHSSQFQLLVLPLRAALAYVQVLPALVDEVMRGRKEGSLGDVGGVDAVGCRTILRELILKETVLIHQAATEVFCEDLVLWSSGVHQMVGRLTRGVLTALASIASGAIQKVLRHGGHSNIPSTVKAFLAAATHGVYYGATESRERTLFVLSALLLHRPSTTAPHTTLPAEDDGRGVSIPSDELSLVKWWLPMISPLAASKDVRVRLAACQLSQQLVASLRRIRDTKVDKDHHCDIPAVFPLTAEYIADLHTTHPAADVSASDDSFVNQYRKLYLACFNELQAVISSGTVEGKRLALPNALKPSPTKEFLVAEGKQWMWCTSNPPTDLDHVLIPQHYL